MNEINILKLLRSPDSDDRRNAIYKIAEENDGYLSDNSLLLKETVKLLEDEVKGVRDAALGFLMDNQYESVVPQVVKLLENERIEVRNLATELLFSYGELSLPYLYIALQSPDKDVRKFAVDILGAISSDECLDKITELIDDPDPNVRFSVLEAFGNIGNPQCAQTLRYVYETYPDMRSVVLETIGKLKLKEFLPYVNKSLKSEEPIEKFAAIETLGILGGKEEIREIESLLAYTDEFYIPEIIHAVIRIAQRINIDTDLPLRKPEYITHIIEKLGEYDYNITEYVKANLTKIVDLLPVSEWMNLFLESDEEMKYIFLNYLRKKSPDKLKQFITDSFLKLDMDGKNQLLDQAADLIDRNVLISVLDSDDEWLRFRIIEILEVNELQGMVGKFVEWLTSYNEILQLSAKTALAKLGIETFSDFLVLTTEENIDLDEESKDRIRGVFND